MNEANRLRDADKASIVCLAIITTATSAAMIGWLPAWAGAVASLGALLGMLLVVRRAGALRTGLLVLFFAVLAAAAAYGWLFASRG